MSAIIQAEKLGKKYILSHQRKESYYALRDVMADAVKRWGRKMRHPLSALREPDPFHEEFWALQNVSFEINQGDRVGIIGRNGAGKSTLLKILSRITEPTEGRVEIRGRVASLLEVGTGFHPELTGRENIYLNGAILGMSKREIKRKFDEIVAFAEVEKFLDTPVKRYSSGMYVRLAFSVAAHLDPEILIVDEVLAVGDAEFQKKCLGKMESVEKEGRTVLFVSHNMGAINRLTSRCFLLHKGALVSSGSTSKVIKDYLSSSIHGETAYDQPHNDGKDMNLRRVIFNPGSEEKTEEVRYDRPIVIRLEYEVNRPVTNCTVWLAIETIEGVMVFTTADYDQNTGMLQQRAPGYYRSDVVIPARWLNGGQYVAVVGIVKNTPVLVYDRVEALSFTVIEIGSPGSILQAGTRRGVLQPILDWTHAKI